MAVAAGLDGWCGADSWCPIRVSLANEGAGIEGTLRVSAADTYNTSVHSQPVVLPTHSRKTYFLYFPPIAGGARPVLDVQLVAGREILASRQVALRYLDATERLYGVVSSRPGDLNVLNAVAPAGGRAFAAQLSLDGLPANPLGWEGLDALVLNDVDTSRLTTDQRRALRTWLAQGGHLIVGGGGGAPQTAAGVADLLPVTIGAVRSLDRLEGLEEWVGAATLGGPYPVAEATLQAGSAVVRQGTLILLARREVGAGTVDFLAFDASLNPFPTQQEDQVRLWTLILDVPAARQQLSVTDSYSAHNALAAIPGLKPPSILHIAGFLLLYTAMVGPLNYLLLRRLRRREWAWLTIPTIVILFTLLAYITGFQIRGHTPILHRLAVIYTPAGSQSGRVTELVGLFSPKRTRYDITVHQGAARPIGSAYYDEEMQRLHVTEDAGVWTVSGLRVDVGGIQSFIIDGWVEIAPPTSNLQFTSIAAAGLQISGTVQNGPVALQDAVLLIGQSEQQLGDLAPGQTIVISATPATTMLPAASLPERIMGAAPYWSDRDLYRRYALLQAFFPYGATLEQGVYLAGWSDAAPLPVEIAGHESSTSQTACYIYKLTTTPLLGSGSIYIPAALITRQIEDALGYMSTDSYIYVSGGTPVVLRFTVWPEVMVDQVDRLTLRLEAPSYYSSYSHLLPYVTLWNWETETWEEQAIHWGNNDITSPSRYVHPDGMVRVQLQTDADQFLELETVLITIEGWN